MYLSHWNQKEDGVPPLQLKMVLGLAPLLEQQVRINLEGDNSMCIPSPTDFECMYPSVCSFLVSPYLFIFCEEAADIGIYSFRILESSN